jgi:hypothetical protein
MHLRNTVATSAELLHGGMTRDERRAALSRFGRTGLLLATDAAGEGLNLHETSRIVINLELPWNPMRLEQRIGRVDRIGQTRRVHAFHMIAAESDEMEMRERLSARIAAADAAIGAADPLQSAAAWSAHPRTLRLTTDASNEAERLARARRLSAPVAAPHAGLADSHEASIADLLERGPRVARPHSATRVHLQGRRLALLMQSAETRNGHRVAFRIVGATWPRRRALTLDELETIAQVTASLQTTTWNAAAFAPHDSFWACRLERLRAIAHDLDVVQSPAQPGLFDRRELRSLALTESRVSAARLNLSDRIDAAVNWRVLTTTTPVVVLALDR